MTNLSDKEYVRIAVMNYMSTGTPLPCTPVKESAT